MVTDTKTAIKKELDMAIVTLPLVNFKQKIANHLTKRTQYLSSDDVYVRISQQKLIHPATGV
jgi:hypothetical protein